MGTESGVRCRWVNYKAVSFHICDLLIPDIGCLDIDKKADIVACVVCSARSSNVKISAKEGDECPYSDGLKSELH